MATLRAVGIQGTGLGLLWPYYSVAEEYHRERDSAKLRTTILDWCRANSRELNEASLLRWVRGISSIGTASLISFAYANLNEPRAWQRLQDHQAGLDWLGTEIMRWITELKLEERATALMENKDEKRTTSVALRPDGHLAVRSEGLLG